MKKFYQKENNELVFIYFYKVNNNYEILVIFKK